MSTTLILIRHGETRLNVLGVFQGQLDEPLNDVGLGQARAVAASMAGLEPDTIYTSDLLRAKQTADEVAKLTGHEVRTDERLREIHCGSWHGRGERGRGRRDQKEGVHVLRGSHVRSHSD